MRIGVQMEIIKETKNTHENYPDIHTHTQQDPHNVIILLLLLLMISC